MTRSLKALRLIGLLASSVVFGLTLSHVLQSPGSRGLDGPTWLSVQHTFYGGFAIIGGLAEVIGVAATTTDTVFSRRRPRAALAPAFAALCLLGTLLSYFFGNRPVNSKVADWTPATLPADWSSYRDTWETAHAVSAILSALALLVLLVATIWPPAAKTKKSQTAEVPSRPTTKTTIAMAPSRPSLDRTSHGSGISADSVSSNGWARVSDFVEEVEEVAARAG